MRKSPIVCLQVACLPNGSWSTAITSSFVNKFNVKSSSFSMSQPISKGAEKRHQRLMCRYCSSGFSLLGCGLPHPTVPTTSISGSFQLPGFAHAAALSCSRAIFFTLVQVSVISLVVRQQLPPTESPHFHTSDIPYWHRLKTISRGCCLRYAPMILNGLTAAFRLLPPL